MYGNPDSEHTIRSRAVRLTEALMVSSSQPERYAGVKETFQREASEAAVPADEMSWFAMGRVAQAVKQPAVRWSAQDDAQGLAPVPAGALVWVDEGLQPTSERVSALQSASLVLAPEHWRPALEGLLTVVFAAPKIVTPSPAPRPPRLG